jgi:hypothetical protein
MNAHKKTPYAKEVSFTRLQLNATASILALSKRIGAMTNQLYTISIKCRKPIVFNYALVSPKHCELNADLSLTFKKADQTQKNYKEWARVRPLTPTTNILSNKDGWNEQVQTSSL